MTGIEALDWIIAKHGTGYAAAEVMGTQASVVSNWRGPRGISPSGYILIWMEANRLGARLPKDFLLQGVKRTA